MGKKKEELNLSLEISVMKPTCWCLDQPPVKKRKTRYEREENITGLMRGNVREHPGSTD